MLLSRSMTTWSSPEAGAHRPMVGVPFQCLRRRRCRPALGQQQDGVPPLPFPGRRSQNYPPAEVLDFHLLLFENLLYMQSTGYPSRMPGS